MLYFPFNMVPAYTDGKLLLPIVVQGFLINQAEFNPSCIFTINTNRSVHGLPWYQNQETMWPANLSF